MTARFPLIAALLLFGCDGGGEVVCGPGTVLVDGVCVVSGMGSTPPPAADAGPGTPPPPPMADAGTPSSGTDAGSGSDWGTTPPGTPPPPPGCDEASGECDAWESALLTLVSTARGCGAPLAIEPGVQRVADRHAAHQASLDRLTASSPDGDLFAQVRAEGATFMYAGATFSVTRDGAEDVMGRWADNPDTAGVLGQCWTGAGVAIETSATGASYVTVLLVR